MKRFFAIKISARSCFISYSYRKLIGLYNDYHPDATQTQDCETKKASIEAEILFKKCPERDSNLSADRQARTSLRMPPPQDGASTNCVASYNNE